MAGSKRSSEDCSGESVALTRRDLLKGAGAAACAAGASRLCLARERTTTQTDEQALGEAQSRIRKHRQGRAVLRFVGSDGRPLGPGVGLRISQTKHKFLFGCNIFKLGRCRTAADNAGYETHFAELLNYATLPFYWWMYERRRDRPDDARTEEIIRWCQGHGVTMKGHPLAWNWADPPWLADVTPDEAMRLQFERIRRCAERFKGSIDIWDVVNEATHYDRDEPRKRSPRLTQAIANLGVGEYVRTAFKAARGANPQAVLIINDYRTDVDFEKKVLSLLVDEGGKPLYDVIGIQSHMHGGYWGAARTWEVCERFARFGKPLHFTETTVVSGPKQGATWATTPEGEQRQAKWVTEFYTMLYSHPAVEAITWWDFTDQNAWQGAPAGLIRDDMTPKPAYEQLHDLIKGQWWTKTEAQTGPDGKLAFQGFLGQYEVEVGRGDQRRTGKFALEMNREDAVEVQLL